MDEDEEELPLTYEIRLAQLNDILNGSLRILFEFIDIAIHQVLYYRHLYPRQAFEQRLKYGMTCQMCQYAAITDYLDTFFTEALDKMKSGKLKSIQLEIYSEQDDEVEEEVFVLWLNLNEKLINL